MSKRILVISPTPTHPTNAGNRIRIRQLVDALCGLGHEVHLLVASREQSDPAAMQAWLGERMHVTPYHWRPRRETLVSRLARWIKQAIDSDSRHLWRLDDWYDPELDAEIDRLQRQHRFEVVVVEYVFFSRALERFGPEVFKVIDTHDRFTMRHRLYLDMGLPAQFYSTTESDEARGLARADLVLAIQDKEREFFARICRRPVVTVGHLVTVEPLLRGDGGRDEFAVLVVGSANAINIQGVQEFVRETWPLVRKEISTARLLLAGAVCKAEIEGEGIIRLGFVDDIRDAYRQANVVVNPVRNSTGLNIKSIEALGYGMPFVTSVAGARGLDSSGGRNFVVADVPTDMAAAIVEIHHYRELAESLSAAAAAYARTWNRSALRELSAHLA